MLDDVKNQFSDKAAKAIAAYQEELKKVRTGRASTAVFDKVMVDYYGTPTPINQVAQISVPEARLITISPWEKNMLAPIEKAILKAELGFNPNNDGSIIRITIAPLTQETRVELAKSAKQIADQEKKGLDEVQKLTDKFIDEITKIFEKKEKEILEF